MDLSKFNDADYEQLKKGNIQGMSDQGYQEYKNQYQQMRQAQAQAANPQISPDSADKAAAPKQTYLDHIHSVAEKLIPHSGYSFNPDMKDSPFPPDTLLGKIASIQAAGRGGLIKGASFGNLDPSALPGVKEGMSQHPYISLAGQLAGGVATGALAGAGVSALAPAGSGLVSALGRIAASAAGGVGQAIAQKPAEGESRLDNISFSKHPLSATLALLPGAVTAASEAYIPMANALANSSMLRAVGLTGSKKGLPPDLGNRIADEGLWGTKAGMAKQVSEKYRDAEQQIQDLASSLEGNVSGDTIADAIANKAKQYLNPEDASKVISGREGGVDSFSKVSDAVRKGASGYSPSETSVSQVPTEFMDASGNPITQSVSQVSPTQSGVYGGKGLLALKRAGDAEAFNQSGQMGNTYAADAYRAQADEARSALANLSSGEMPEALRREQTLLLANKGLMKPNPVYKNPMSLTDIGGGLIGAASGGLPGAGTAVLTSKAIASPLIQSLFGQAMQKSSNVAQDLSDPAIIQSLFGAVRGASEK